MRARYVPHADLVDVDLFLEPTQTDFHRAIYHGADLFPNGQYQFGLIEGALLDVQVAKQIQWRQSEISVPRATFAGARVQQSALSRVIKPICGPFAKHSAVGGRAPSQLLRHLLLERNGNKSNRDGRRKGRAQNRNKTKQTRA